MQSEKGEDGDLSVTLEPTKDGLKVFATNPGAALRDALRCAAFTTIADVVWMFIERCVQLSSICAAASI